MALEVPFTEYSKFFIAMIAIVDPFAILPVYVRLIIGLEESSKNRLARRVAAATTIALIISLFLGEDILRFFGISLASFRIAGGLLLLVMGMQLIYENTSTERTTEPASPGSIDSQVVVPIAIPLLAGPGAFSTVIVYSFRSNTWEHYALMTLALLVIGSIIWFSLHMGAKIMQRMGPTAMAVINKVLGLIIVAISVEFIATGIAQFVVQAH